MDSSVDFIIRDEFTIFSALSKVKSDRRSFSITEQVIVLSIFALAPVPIPSESITEALPPCFLIIATESPHTSPCLMAFCATPTRTLKRDFSSNTITVLISVTVISAFSNLRLVINSRIALIFL